MLNVASIDNRRGTEWICIFLLLFSSARRKKVTLFEASQLYLCSGRYLNLVMIGGVAHLNIHEEVRGVFLVYFDLHLGLLFSGTDGHIKMM